MRSKISKRKTNKFKPHKKPIKKRRIRRFQKRNKANKMKAP